MVGREREREREEGAVCERVWKRVPGVKWGKGGGGGKEVSLATHFFEQVECRTICIVWM